MLKRSTVNVLVSLMCLLCRRALFVLFWITCTKINTHTHTKKEDFMEKRNKRNRALFTSKQVKILSYNAFGDSTVCCGEVRVGVFVHVCILCVWCWRCLVLLTYPAGTSLSFTAGNSDEPISVPPFKRQVLSKSLVSS